MTDRNIIMQSHQLRFIVAPENKFSFSPCDQHLIDFLATKSHLSKDHQENCRRIVLAFCSFIDWPPDEQDIISYIAHCKARGLADSTVRLHFVLVRAFIAFLVKNQRIPPIDLDSIRQPITPEILPRGPDDSSTKALFDHLESRVEQAIKNDRLLIEWRLVRDLAMFSLMYDTGLRISEVSSLRVRDTKLDKSTILVYKGKRKKQRIMPFARTCRADLRLWLNVRSELLILSPTVPYLFIKSKAGFGQFGRWGIRNRLHVYCDQLGIEHFTPHQFRHAYAGYALKNGLELGKLQRRLGHSTPAMTLRYAMLAEDTDGQNQVSPRDNI